MRQILEHTEITAVSSIEAHVEPASIKQKALPESVPIIQKQTLKERPKIIKEKPAEKAVRRPAIARAEKPKPKIAKPEVVKPVSASQNIEKGQKKAELPLPSVTKIVEAEEGPVVDKLAAPETLVVEPKFAVELPETELFISDEPQEFAEDLLSSAVLELGLDNLVSEAPVAVESEPSPESPVELIAVAMESLEPAELVIAEGLVDDILETTQELNKLLEIEPGSTELVNEIRQELEELCAELFEHLGIDDPEKLQEFITYLTSVHEVTSENSEFADQFTEEGTHEKKPTDLSPAALHQLLPPHFSVWLELGRHAVKARLVMPANRAA